MDVMKLKKRGENPSKDMSAGQSMVHIEPVFSCLVHISGEDSGRLPLHVDGEDQPPSQVIKQLICLIFAQGTLVHPDATFH